MYDVIIIGGGVIGAFAARSLSQYNLRVLLLEKENDLACGTSKANSGIVHSGYDPHPGTLKARLNVRGSAMMEEVCTQLSVPYRRNGALVLAFDKDDMEAATMLYLRGKENGVPEMQLLGKEDTLSLEPAVSPEIEGALYLPGSGIVCPYILTINAGENAVANGAEVQLNHEVTAIEKGDCFTVTTNRGSFTSSYVVNAAGLYGDKIAAMVGDTSFEIVPKKGEYLLMDKSFGGMVNATIFQIPTKLGKGVLVTPTADGNLMIGPSTVDADDVEDLSVTQSSIDTVKLLAKKSVPAAVAATPITTFAGNRASTSVDDFIIEESSAAKGFINLAGINSPGLTAAPAIGEYLCELLQSLGLQLQPKQSFNPLNTKPKPFVEMTTAEKEAAIASDPNYSEIICRCECVTKAEILQALTSSIPAADLDGIKRRVRAGAGRCQSGFCYPKLIELMQSTPERK